MYRLGTSVFQSQHQRTRTLRNLKKTPNKSNLIIDIIKFDLLTTDLRQNTDMRLAAKLYRLRLLATMSSNACGLPQRAGGHVGAGQSA
jgi:hypothetical protein